MVKDILSLLNFFFMTFSIACSLRSDSRTREKNSRRKKNEGRLAPPPPWVGKMGRSGFPAFVPLEKVLFLAIYGNRSLINQSCLVKIAAWILSFYWSWLRLSPQKSSNLANTLPSWPWSKMHNYILQQITGKIEPGGLGKVWLVLSNPQHCSIEGRGGI